MGRIIEGCSLCFPSQAPQRAEGYRSKHCKWDGLQGLPYVIEVLDSIMTSYATFVCNAQ